jgi:hypothetical protein
MYILLKKTQIRKVFCISINHKALRVIMCDNPHSKRYSLEQSGRMQIS